MNFRTCAVSVFLVFFLIILSLGAVLAATNIGDITPGLSYVKETGVPGQDNIFFPLCNHIPDKIRPVKLLIPAKISRVPSNVITPVTGVLKEQNPSLPSGGNNSVNVSSSDITGKTNSTHAIMHLSDEQIHTHLQKRKSTPGMSYQGPDLPKGHKSLLSYLPYIGNNRDQGYCGNCWVWGSTGAMEIEHSVDNSLKSRLSIQYFDSNWWKTYGFGYGACGGGWPSDFAEYYNEILKKAIPWSNKNAGYKDYYISDGYEDPGINASKISTIPNYNISSVTSRVLSTDTSVPGNAINTIKSQLNAKKSVIYTFWLNDAGWTAFYNYWNNMNESSVWDPTPYVKGYQAGGHVVLIVGYDDTAAVPYWICLNSWGTSSLRPQGLYRLKMNIPYNARLSSGDVRYLANNFEIFNIDYYPPPKITKITPSASLSSKNTVVTISGKNFRTGAVVKLIRGKTIMQATVANTSSTRIVCTLPTKGIATGMWKLKITNTDGTVVTKNNAFAVR